MPAIPTPSAPKPKGVLQDWAPAPVLVAATGVVSVGTDALGDTGTAVDGTPVPRPSGWRSQPNRLGLALGQRYLHLPHHQPRRRRADDVGPGIDEPFEAKRRSRHRSVVEGHCRRVGSVNVNDDRRDTRLQCLELATGVVHGREERDGSLVGHTGIDYTIQHVLRLHELAEAYPCARKAEGDGRRVEKSVSARKSSLGRSEISLLNGRIALTHELPSGGLVCFRRLSVHGCRCEGRDEKRCQRPAMFFHSRSSLPGNNGYHQARSQDFASCAVQNRSPP